MPNMGKAYTYVKLNQVGLLRKPWWVAANSINANSVGRIVGVNYTTQPRSYTISFPLQADVRQIFFQGDFEEIVIPKKAFCIVPFWYVPIGFLIRFNNTWWTKKTKIEAQEIGPLHSFCFPKDNELVIVDKKEFKKWHNQGPKCLMLEDSIVEEFEVSANVPF